MDKDAVDIVTFNSLNNVKNGEIQFRCSVANDWIYGLICDKGHDPNLDLPVVVCLHDWGGNRQGPHRMFVNLARWLSGEGIRVVRFDFRGRGESAGNTASTTYQTMMRDLIKIHEMIVQLFTTSQIYLLGFCSGATIACSYSLYLPGIAGTILLSVVPAKTADDSGNDDLRDLFDLIPVDCQEDRISIRTFRQRTLLIYGSNDPDHALSLQHYSRLFRKQEIPYEVEIIRGANHGFFSTQWEQEIFRSIGRWLNSASN